MLNGSLDLLSQRFDVPTKVLPGSKMKRLPKTQTLKRMRQVVGLGHGWDANKNRDDRNLTCKRCFDFNAHPISLQLQPASTLVVARVEPALPDEHENSVAPTHRLPQVLAEVAASRDSVEVRKD